MSRSPAILAKQRTQARLAAASSPHGAPVSGDAHSLLLAQLVEHRRRLKDIQSIERKIEAKRAFLPVYQPWIEETLRHGNGGQDPIITTLLIWCIDVGEFNQAGHIAAYCLKHGLDLPDQYERSLPVALIDEFSAAALAGKMPPGEDAAILQAVLDLTAQYDAPDQARAKLHKAFGYALIKKAGPADVELEGIPLPDCARALTHLQRALELFEQVGTKKDIERLARHLKKSQPDLLKPDPSA
jgi:hypothetical protein